MSILYWLGPILNILAILGIIAGLYIAGRFLPSFIDWVHSFYPSNLLSHLIPKTIVWLALGTLFTSPLLDLVSFLGILFNVTLAPQGMDKMTTLFGTVPIQIYLIFSLLLMIIVYGIIIFYGKEFITSSPQFQQTERIFIVLAIASLVFGGINSVFTHIISFQIPSLAGQRNYGIPGYLFEIFIGFVILIIILFGLNRLLSKQPASKQ